MQTIEIIKARIQSLYRQDPHVHLDVSLSSPKLVLKNTPATITGVYRHIFQIEEHTSGKAQRHTLQYTDLVTGQIVIRELT